MCVFVMIWDISGRFITQLGAFWAIENDQKNIFSIYADQIGIITLYIFFNSICKQIYTPCGQLSTA